MSRSPFDPKFDDLRDILPIFPLPGALLLPGGRLPLNIFEPRYLNMVHDAVAGDRMIGMIQPRAESDDPGGAETYRTGCAGRIVEFSECDDGRYLITLGGIIRFDVARERPLHRGYRRVEPDYRAYRGDLNDDTSKIDRASLTEALRNYFEFAGIEGDWTAIDKSPDAFLVTSLAMVCPFDPQEKQALLEVASLADRAKTMTAILKMAVLDGGSDAPRH
jgi:hypothetical protein